MQVRVGWQARNVAFQINDLVLLESTCTGPVELSQLVMHLLADRENKPRRPLVFWIQSSGERILGTLQDHLGSLGCENVLFIEFDEEMEVPHMEEEIREPDWIRAVAINPEKSHLLTGSFDRSLRLYSLPLSSTQISSTTIFKNSVLTEVPTCIVWLGDSRFVVGYSNGTKLVIWNVSNPSTPEQFLIKDNLSAVQDILTFDNVILVADHDGNVWKYSTDPMAAVLPAPSKKSRPSKLLSSLRKASPVTELAVPEQSSTLSIRVNDGAIAKIVKLAEEIYCFGWNGNVTVLSSQTLTIRRRLRLAADISAALILDEKLITAHGDGSIRLYGREGDLIRKGIGCHKGWISALSAGPTSSTFSSTGHDGNVFIWSIKDFSVPLCSLLPDQEQKGKILCLDWNGKLIACGGEEKIVRVFDTSNVQ